MFIFLSWRIKPPWQLGTAVLGGGSTRTGHLTQQQQHILVISQCTETPTGATLFTKAFFLYFINLNIEGSFLSFPPAQLQALFPNAAAALLGTRWAGVSPSPGDRAIFYSLLFTATLPRRCSVFYKPHKSPSAQRYDSGQLLAQAGVNPNSSDLSLSVWKGIKQK